MKDENFEVHDVPVDITSYSERWELQDRQNRKGKLEDDAVEGFKFVLLWRMNYSLTMGFSRLGENN